MGGRNSKPQAPAAPALGSVAGSFADVQNKFSSATTAPPAAPAATENKRRNWSWFGFRAKVKADDKLARQRGAKPSKAVRKVGECRVALDDGGEAAVAVHMPSGWGGGAGVQQPTSAAAYSAPKSSCADASSSTGPVKPPPPAVDAVDRAARVAKARTLAASISKIATGGDPGSSSGSRKASGVDTVSLKERVATFREHEEEVRRAASALLETKPKVSADKKRLKALALAVNGDETIRKLASADCVNPRGEPGQGLDVAMARQLGCYASLCGGIVGKLATQMPSMSGALATPTGAYLTALNRHQALAIEAEVELGGGRV